MDDKWTQLQNYAQTTIRVLLLIKRVRELPLKNIGHCYEEADYLDVAQISLTHTNVRDEMISVG